MTGDPYTIRIFVKNGDPEGVRIIDQMNWTGQGIVFPREKWTETRLLKDFDLPGVYILIGFSDDDDLPTIYIGEGDGLRGRIDAHDKNKDFWTWAIAFVSTNNSLNKAHVQWLEYALVKQANDAKRCRLDNGNTPQEPALSESEKAGTRSFLKEVLRILPLTGLRALETPKAVAHPETKPSTVVNMGSGGDEKDTIIVPAQKDGFNETFIGEQCWYAIRIAGGMLQKTKWIAAYQTQPVSAVTHVAPVDRIEPYGEGGKYRIIFSAPAKEILPIPFGSAPSGSMQSPRYTTYRKLMSAKNILELVG
ncbi:MAG: GIY-YIG nuclease family protein [Ferrovibrio sp.]|nr:GIY-YIG nuclease family protein [Ferrovibrio sp.]